MTPCGLYVHFAHCRRKCDYCDFNSVVADPAARARYLQALGAEIARAPALAAGTVYFGGGTPTLLRPAELGATLAAAAERFDIASDAEITLEANPGTVTRASLRALRRAGFNRLSLGVQSLADAELRLLGRIHTAAQARRAVAEAREAGFDNLSLDLMRGLPGQRLADWQRTVEAAVALAPDHISAYGLTLEPGTPLAAKVAAGELPPPVGEAAATWVTWTVTTLRRAGYARYEISNYARPGHQCRHNLNYWLNGDYVGLGAGAWSYLGGERRRNAVDPATYADWALGGTTLVVERERLDPQSALGETLMLGLRLTAGLEYTALSVRFGVDVPRLHGALIQRLIAGGLLVADARRLRLTPRGMLVQSAVAAEFLA